MVVGENRPAAQDSRAPTRRPTVVSPSDLDEVLDRARAENWRALALLGPRESRASTVPFAQTFRMREPLGPRLARLLDLTQLTSLDLRDNQLGADGACALAGLTQLTSLDLSGNQLGDDGACALAGLTQLTSLDLSSNQVGDGGARVLAG